MIKILWLAILLLILPGFPTLAQFEDPDISGLLINNTRTRIGHEFYRLFCAEWGDVRSRHPYNINIREIPDARWGSLMIVELNQRQTYRKILGMRTVETDREVDSAIRATRGYLLYLIRGNGNLESVDLRGDGL